MTIQESLGEALLVDRVSKSNQIARRKREGRFILSIAHVIARAAPCRPKQSPKVLEIACQAKAFLAMT